MVSLGASAVLGLGALAVAKIWLPAQAPRTQTSAQAAPAPVGVPVVIARSAIGYGTRLEARNLTVANLPRSAVPEGAFTSIAAVINQPDGAPVALQSIHPREPILANRISGPGARASLAATIGTGMRAYSIPVSEISGGGGHILPGDRIDVLVTRELPPTNEGGGRRFVSSVVLQDVRVLGMDLNDDPESTEAAVARTATLEVTLQDTVRLALAGQAGTLSLALRRAGESAVTPIRPVGLENPGSRPDRRAASQPAAPASATPAAPRRDPNRRTVIVASGAAQAAVDVPSAD
jgi:pilus assembly protein CpaB